MMNLGFRMMTPSFIFFGHGVSKQIGPILKTQMGVDTATIFADPIIRSSGLTEGIETSLKSFGITFTIYSELDSNPTHTSIMKAAKFLKDNPADIVIAIGGGSTIDAAKLARGMTVAPPPIAQYVDIEGSVKGWPVRQVSIPTTAGTGAEITAGGVVADDDTHIKGIVSGPGLMSTAAFCDPELTLSLPQALTASTGMDALTHAIEGVSSQARNPVADIYHFEAIKLIASSLRTAYSDGKDRNARYNMMMGAMLAGIAMHGSSCGAAHGFAYPLEGRGDWTHGDANAAVLPAVMRHNAPAVAPIYRRVAEAMGENVRGLSDREAAFRACDAVEQLCKDVKIPRLKDRGITEDDVEDLAMTVMTLSRALGNNTTLVTPEDAEMIYKASL